MPVPTIKAIEWSVFLKVAKITRDIGQPFNHEEQLLFRNKPGLWPLYEQLSEQIIRLYPSTIVQVKNTQIFFIDKHLYACVSFLRLKRAPNLEPGRAGIG